MGHYKLFPCWYIHYKLQVKCSCKSKSLSCQTMVACYLSKQLNRWPCHSVSEFLSCSRQLNRWPCHSVSPWVSGWFLISASSEHCRAVENRSFQSVAPSRVKRTRLCRVATANLMINAENPIKIQEIIKLGNQLGQHSQFLWCFSRYMLAKMSFT